MVKLRGNRQVAVIIPTYNEATQLASVVIDVRKQLAASGYNATVVVVDDGSHDDSALIGRKAGAKVIKHILNTGAGGATATGLSYANQHGFRMAATMDADGQHSSADVVAGFNRMKQGDCDLLIGSRLIDSHGMSRVKVLGNRGLSIITYVLFGINSTDSQSGLRVFSRQALERLRWETSGYEFCSEMLWRARQLDLNIGEYPIKAIYTDYSKAKGQNNWNAINIVKALLKRRVSELLG